MSGNARWADANTVYQPGLEVVQNPLPQGQPVHERISLISDGPTIGYAKSGPNVQEYRDPSCRPLRSSNPIPFGLSLAFYTTFIILITAIVIGGAVGGGLGAKLADIQSKQEKTNLVGAEDSSNSTTVTATVTTPVTISSTITQTTTATVSSFTDISGLVANYVVTPPSQISSLDFDMDALNGTTYQTVHDITVRYDCDITATEGDVASIVAYTIDDYVEGCTSLNFWLENTSFVSHISFTSVINAFPGQHANCWCKNDQLSLHVGDGVSCVASVVSS